MVDVSHPPPLPAVSIVAPEPVTTATLSQVPTSQVTVIGDGKK